MKIFAQLSGEGKSVQYLQRFDSDHDNHFSNLKGLPGAGISRALRASGRGQSNRLGMAPIVFVP